jgi:hypothetical protein
VLFAGQGLTYALHGPAEQVDATAPGPSSTGSVAGATKSRELLSNHPPIVTMARKERSAIGWAKSASTTPSCNVQPGTQTLAKAIAPRPYERLQPCLRLRALQQGRRASQSLAFRKTLGHERSSFDIELGCRYSWSLAAFTANVPQLPKGPPGLVFGVR